MYNIRYRKIVLFFAFVTLGWALRGQQYVGTLTIGNYTQRGVEVSLATPRADTTALTLFDVKFSRMMPVRLDVVIPSLTLREGRLSADRTVPASGKKRYEKFLVQRLRGQADAERLSFSCQMGKKMLSFSGARKNSR